MTTTPDQLREEVRRRYAQSARTVTDGSGRGCGSGGCCADGESDAAKFGEALYDAEQRGELPEAATLASLGCGNPTAVAEPARGRDGARSRLRRRDRRDPLGEARRRDRNWRTGST